MKKIFIEDGFSLPEAKGNVSWIDPNLLLVSTHFGEGTLTTSGYPRIVKLWKRGTPLSKAKKLYEGDITDVSTRGFIITRPEKQYVMVHRGLTFYTSNTFVLENDKLIQLDIPDDANFSRFFKNHQLIILKSDWHMDGKTYKQGALIGIDYAKYLEGNRDFSVIYEPDDRSSVTSIASTKNFIFL